MPSSDPRLELRVVAARYLVSAFPEGQVPAYLGARLVRFGMTEAGDGKADDDSQFASHTQAALTYFSTSKASETGPYFFAMAEGVQAKYIINDFLVFPSLRIAQGLAAWLRALQETATCTIPTHGLVQLYLQAVESGDLASILEAGAKLSDAFDEDWYWQRIGLIYAKRHGDGPGVGEQLHKMVTLPRERSAIINLLIAEYQVAQAAAKQTPGPLSDLTAASVIPVLKQYGHLPWGSSVGLTAALSATTIDANAAETLSSDIDTVLNQVGPAYWHQAWQAVLSDETLRANEQLVRSVSDAISVLCIEVPGAALGRRAIIYMTLCRCFYYRIEAEYRGLNPAGALWSASILASDVESALAGLEGEHFESVLKFLKQLEEQHSQAWSIWGLESEPSVMQDIFSTKQTLWPLAVCAIPSSIPIDAITIPDDYKPVFTKIVRECGLVFTVHPDRDSDEGLPVLDLLARNRVNEWTAYLQDADLNGFLAEAKRVQSVHGAKDLLLAAIKNLPSLPTEEALIVVLMGLSRLRAHAVTAKELLSVIGTEEWVKDVMPKIPDNVLDMFMSMLTTSPVVTQRDDLVKLAHWCAYVYSKGLLGEHGMKAVAVTTVVVALKASAYSAIARLSGAQSHVPGIDLYQEVNSMILKLEQQTPPWMRGRLRAAKVALMPMPA